ncbi:1-acyl-sn-glycerol-3-phosphate acyltransferase [Cryobacterium sp. TMT1-21]|uniref:1-acyl-sn-glycerol-3-phosphate acyltransferase n=1 Tax=Cryobacterium shii TaxID=1259235 RepID=A0AAQ2C5T5_9MICO|nr:MULTISPECIES: lysophospholipid acyltransferase family protein [Cryobacterium]TFC45857.1 1-acyl-sn-glycerol-3-phosphate acyltransferase [Cryobacterium shii]TFC84426.1 1-acyl-sn-glycerol-3-phosphate acyltransferase [Cryobacterium sp. TmT2-59]TFD08729.1 1-acyl-sn-glycerol-3-phosphate acyltransferase [Cryobacterium sp. TMT1-21]TFD18518.1 1-acyl-sn-glycerol-3-phosphate acyltransferase [Cryobacterium sp. TMT4-10]TFD26302.1 1-acyl-sn-glycerol-3-phosphate acyltransferase [Cryobacterium sp. TMT2-23]
MTRRESEPLYTTAITAGRAVFGLLRLKPSVTGLKNLPDTGGAVLAITHFGYMDFALVEWMLWHKNRRHIRFMAKKGAFDQKLVGVLLRGMRHISVDMKAGAEAYGQAVKALKEGELLGVFPEGGVNASFTVRELKSGAVRMAAEAGVPIIPIAVWGGHRLLTKNHKPSLREASGVPVSFAVGEAFTVAELSAAAGEDAQSLTQALHGTLQGLVDGLQAAYPVDGAGQWWQPRHLGGTAPTPEVAAVAEAERRRLRDAKAQAGSSKTSRG